MVQNPSLLSRISKPLPCKRPGGALSPLRPYKRHRLGPLPNGNNREQRSHSQSSGDHWKPTKRHQTQLHRGMLDVPAELFLAISAHMDHRDLRALALTSRFLCDLLLPEYLRGRGLKLKGTYTGGTGVDLYDLSGYASLGLWSIVPIFRPPKTMYCSIPYDAQEARSAIGFLMRFLLDPSNSTNLQSFHFSIWGVDPLPIMSELIKMQGLFCVLPLTRLCISGYGSAALLPSSITLRSGMSCGSYTLTSLHISSDLSLRSWFSANHDGDSHAVPYQESGNIHGIVEPFPMLNMTLLEDIEVEGDIPRPALILLFDEAQGPQDLDQLRPHDHLFLHLVEALRRFQKLDHLGLRFVPSSSSAIPQASPEVDSWDGHPARELRQDMVCAYIQSFPTLQVVHVAEEGTAVRTELLESLRKASPTLRVVTISSGSFLKWTADAMD
ncbi:hypothetical protein EDB85DRAFT_1895430 [Lactarius pseudohatsudake]|nr:hypothetical protein EDB85DRAFT_1895430 [Lactarius pseudohatsudake]